MRSPTLIRILFSVIILGMARVFFTFGKNIPFAEQWVLYEGLRNTASIIFGVMGAWLAIVYPEVLSNIIEKRTSSGAQNYNKLIAPLVYSTITLIWVMMLGIIVPILKQVSFFVSHSNSLRGISFSILCVLTLLQIWALILTLLPADMTKRTIDRVDGSHKAQQRWRSRQQKIGNSENDE